MPTSTGVAGGADAPPLSPAVSSDSDGAHAATASDAAASNATARDFLLTRMTLPFVG